MSPRKVRSGKNGDEIQCRKCNGWFTTEFLSKNSGYPSGVANICKKCHAADTKLRGKPARKRYDPFRPDPIARAILDSNEFWTETNRLV